MKSRSEAHVKEGIFCYPHSAGVRDLCGLQKKLLAADKKALYLRSRARDHEDKTDADVSVENTGWTIKYHIGGFFWVSALPDHTAQQPQTQSKTETKPTGSLGSLRSQSLSPAIFMDIAHQFLQWGLHLAWAQLVFSPFPGGHGI